LGRLPETNIPTRRCSLFQHVGEGPKSDVSREDLDEPAVEHRDRDVRDIFAKKRGGNGYQCIRICGALRTA